MSWFPEFREYPKTPRLFRDIVITEKIDGTNAAVQIFPLEGERLNVTSVFVGGEEYGVVAQSRKRLITKEDDNFGFALWAHEHALELANTLGVGVHYGEWWGSGIQRGYGLPKGEKQFSLFNTKRWDEDNVAGVSGLGVVPTLYEGPFSELAIEDALSVLRRHGSYASPGFHNPEGIVIYHTASNHVYKVLLDNDELPKGLAA